MSFSVADRVQVSDQSDQRRNEYGTVKAVGSGTVDVRCDGMQDNTTVTFNNSQVRPSTQPCPIEYASDS